MRDARALYFSRSGLADGGYDASWVKLQAGAIPLYFPNTGARVRSVRLHDIHHVLTNYDTTWTGEAEIGAWEIASGCARHYAAWILNLQAMAIGIVIAPRATLRAFARGRESRNLYTGEFRDELLATRVGSLRHALGLDRPPPAPATRDVAPFALWVSVGLLSSLLGLLAGLTLIAGLGWLVWRALPWP